MVVVAMIVNVFAFPLRHQRWVDGDAGGDDDDHHLHHLSPWIAIIISTTYWTVMLNFGICQTFELFFQALCSGGVVKVLG